MADSTTHYGFIKPTYDEYDDISNQNSNWDIADEELHKRGQTVNGIGPDDTGDFKVESVQFAHQIVTDDAQQSSDEFKFRTTGGSASLSDGPAKLVSIFGRSVHTGKTEEVLDMTVTPATRQEGEEPITATIDRDTFVAYVATSGTITLSYTDAWSANPTLYGVTVSGTPVDGDQIVIVYVKEDRGLITNSAPDRFVSTGWNLYNHTAGYARAKKYSSQYGFLIGGSYTAVEYSETLTGTKISITPASGYFTIPGDGYIWVTGGNNTTTYILMTWSDWGEGYEGEWEAYTESEIDLTGIMSDFPYGLMQVGGVSDEINFSTGIAVSRIERLAYNAENLATAKASGRPWDADTNYIYLVRANGVTYSVYATGDYEVCDHGLEIIEGGTVPVYVQTLYGQNLVDKLRTDVVTKSQDLINVLTSTATDKALTAAQGKALKDGLDTLNSNFTGIAVPSNDCNSATETGRYVTNLTTANAPSASHWVIDVIKYNANEVSQVARNTYHTNEIQYRAKLNGTWSSWDGANKTSSGTITKHSSITSGTIDSLSCKKVGTTVFASARLHSMSPAVAASGSYFVVPEGYRPTSNAMVFGYMNTVEDGSKTVLATIQPNGVVGLGYSASKTTNQVGFAGCWSTV